MPDLAFKDVIVGDVSMALAFRLVQFDADPVATRLALYLANELYYTLLALVLVGNELNAIAQGEPR